MAHYNPRTQRALQEIGDFSFYGNSFEELIKFLQAEKKCWEENLNKPMNIFDTYYNNGSVKREIQKHIFDKIFIETPYGDSNKFKVIGERDMTEEEKEFYNKRKEKEQEERRKTYEELKKEFENE